MVEMMKRQMFSSERVYWILNGAFCKICVVWRVWLGWVLVYADIKYLFAFGFAKLVIRKVVAGGQKWLLGLHNRSGGMQYIAMRRELKRDALRNACGIIGLMQSVKSFGHGWIGTHDKWRVYLGIGLKWSKIIPWTGHGIIGHTNCKRSWYNGCVMRWGSPSLSCWHLKRIVDLLYNWIDTLATCTWTDQLGLMWE